MDADDNGERARRLTQHVRGLFTRGPRRFDASGREGPRARAAGAAVAASDEEAVARTGEGRPRGLEALLRQLFDEVARDD